MEPKRFQLEGATLPELRARVLAEHGSGAVIVSADRVTVGGIRGFFARQHYEVTVELRQRGRRAARADVDVPTRLGIAALLDDADEAEARAQGPATEQALSTRSDVFAALMDELTFSTIPAVAGSPRPAATPRSGVPKPLAGTGQLVLVVGLAEDALVAARSMVGTGGSDEIRIAGALAAAGHERVDGRPGVHAARARAVERGHAVVVAFGLGSPGAESPVGLALRIAELGSLDADQTWLVVDASRKAEDTARWVHAVAAVVPVDAVAAVGGELTASPGTVDELGFPITWLGRPTPGTSR